MFNSFIHDGTRKLSQTSSKENWTKEIYILLWTKFICMSIDRNHLHPVDRKLGITISIPRGNFYFYGS